MAAPLSIEPTAEERRLGRLLEPNILAAVEALDREVCRAPLGVALPPLPSPCLTVDRRHRAEPLPPLRPARASSC